MNDPVQDRENAYRATQRATLLAELLDEQERKTVNILVNMFRNNDLQSEKAWALIGAISELRQITTSARSDAQAAISIASEHPVQA